MPVCVCVCVCEREGGGGASVTDGVLGRPLGFTWAQSTREETTCAARRDLRHSRPPAGADPPSRPGSPWSERAPRGEAFGGAGGPRGVAGARGQREATKKKTAWPADLFATRTREGFRLASRVARAVGPAGSHSPVADVVVAVVVRARARNWWAWETRERARESERCGRSRLCRLLCRIDSLFCHSAFSWIARARESRQGRLK